MTEPLYHGPMRSVVYIFERQTDRGSALWWLVLECGHSAVRRRYEAKTWSQQVRGMFKSVESKLAPKTARCMSCELGSAQCDPQILIDAFSEREALTPG